MAEEINTQAAPEVTADLNDIDVSDIDFGANDNEEPTEESEKNAAAPKPEEADPQKPEEGEAETEKPEQDDEKQTDQFTLKHLDEVKTVSRDEVIALAQKGMDYDRVRQKIDDLTAASGTLSAEKEKSDSRIALLTDIAHQNGYKDFDDFIDNVQAKQLAERDGIDEATALKQIRLDRKERELAEKEQKLTAERASKDADTETSQKTIEKRNADFAEFSSSKYGSIKPEEIPKEVWDVYGDGNKGYTLLQAYIQVHAEKLESELAAQKKNAENKQRSTGSIASAGKEPVKDPWLADLQSRF